MNDTTPRRHLEDWVNAAHCERTDCPAGDQLHRLVVDSKTAQAESLREHLQECRECAADYDMALLFESDAPSQSEHTVAAIVAKLEAAAPAPSRRRVGRRSAAATSLGDTLRAWTGTLPTWQLGVVASAALALVIFTWPRPPVLPAAYQSTLRGSTVLTIQPRGELALPPTELTWQAHDSAVKYRVRVLSVDDTVLWEQIVELPSTEVPLEIRGQLQPYVRYVWTVDALGDSGIPVAVSEAQSFRIVPTLTP